MWLLNPPNPHCKATRAGLDKRGIGSGDVSSVAVHWEIDVELDDDEFQLYPEAAGHHVLFRRMVHPLPRVGAEKVHFEFDGRAFALWESRPTSPETGIRWRLAYNYDFSGFGGIETDPPALFHLAWILWFSPEYWRAPTPELLNIAFPLYTGSEFCGRRNKFEGLRPNTFRRHSAGNNVLPGVVEFPDFPPTLTVTPFWP